MYITQHYPHESRRDYAFRLIKDNIIHLKLEPGSMVSESKLAAELGMSRGPVREAIIDLAKTKIIDVYPQRGNIISLIDYDLVEEACFMRETLEVAVVERCCIMGFKEEQLTTLQENLKLQRFYLEACNKEKLLEMDNEFHRLLFLSAGVMQVYTLMNSMLVHFDRLRAMALSAVKELKFVDDHCMILAKILQGEVESAKNQMHVHLNRYQVERTEIRKHYPDYVKD